MQAGSSSCTKQSGLQTAGPSLLLLEDTRPPHSNQSCFRAAQHSISVNGPRSRAQVSTGDISVSGWTESKHRSTAKCMQQYQPGSWRSTEPSDVSSRPQVSSMPLPPGAWKQGAFKHERN
ncbi:hypothetical protein EYF80_011588 [Liparis tanakae]|uniref:Uncharacterized protein n=1 Tax=Liparis tanakae TaxID=230148 RepID=A0A4Z2ILN6_9TELE|nr:hypothetical protein EYF80_011588 [Liparis tanakae]